MKWKKLFLSLDFLILLIVIVFFNYNNINVWFLNGETVGITLGVKIVEVESSKKVMIKYCYIVEDEIFFDNAPFSKKVISSMGFYPVKYNKKIKQLNKIYLAKRIVISDSLYYKELLSAYELYK